MTQPDRAQQAAAGPGARERHAQRRRERGLAAERVSSQLEALSTEEQRLAQAVNALIAEREGQRLGLGQPGAANHIARSVVAHHLR